MQSAAIFFGSLILCWGISNLKLALFAIHDDPTGGNSPRGSSFDRWMVHLVTALMLPLPAAALTVGGGAVLRWGFLGG